MRYSYPHNRCGRGGAGVGLVTAAVPRHSLGPARPGAGAFLGVQWQSHCRGERTGETSVRCRDRTLCGGSMRQLSDNG